MNGYSKNFFISLGLHVLLFASFGFSLATHKGGMSAPVAPKVESVQAVVVDEKSVQNEVKRLQTLEQKKQAEANKALKQAQQKRQAEEKKLAKLKADADKTKKEQKKQLAELQTEKVKQEKALEKLKQKHQAEKQQLATQLAEKKSLEEGVVREQQRWASKWEARIGANRRVFLDDAGLRCECRIYVLPDGHVREVQLVKSSGDPRYDEESIRAIYRSEPFELPEEPRLRETLLGESIVVLKGGNHG